jgi:hypothetical protein
VKKIVLINLGVFLFIIGCAELYLKLTNPRDPSKDIATYGRELSFVYEKFTADDNAFMRGFVAHPYFGYVFNKDVGINNFGFITPDDFPYERKKNELVIGVFGGSVGQHFGQYLQKNIDNLPTMKACGEEKKIKIINFGIVTQRQPQAFQIFQFYGDQLDAAIKLDGHNEMRYFPDLGYPREYPTWYGLFFLLTQQKKDELEKIYSLNKWQFRIINLGEQLSFLKKSELYFKFNMALIRTIQYFVRASEKRVEELSVGPIRPEYLFRNDESSLRVWKKYTILQSTVAKQFNVPLISVIQPTQYMEGSKIFTKEEKEIAIDPDVELQGILKKHWNLIGDSIPEVKKAGVNLLDFRKVFANTQEAVFVDKCCHVNDRGNEIMAQIIFDELRKQLKNVNCARFK